MPQIVELVIEGDIRRLPDRAFSHLAVAEEHVCPVVGSDPARVERRADGRADPLAERARRDVDKRQPRRGMALEVESMRRKRGGRREERARRAQARRESARHVPSTARSGRCRDSEDLSDEAHLPEKERRDNLCRRHARRRVAASGLRGRQDRIDAKLGREVLQRATDAVVLFRKAYLRSAARGWRSAFAVAKRQRRVLDLATASRE